MPDGPTTGPRPGPTFAMAVPADDTAVTRSSPISVSAIAATPKVSANRNMKLITEAVTLSWMGLPL